MSETKEEKSRREFGYVRESLPKSLAVIVAVVVTVIADLISGAFEGKPFFKYGLIALGFMALLVAMTVSLSRFKRGSTKVATLKDSLINAFCGVLESSPLNPKAKKGGV